MSELHLCADVAGLHVDALRVADFAHRGTVARWTQEDAELLEVVPHEVLGSGEGEERPTIDVRTRYREQETLTFSQTAPHSAALYNKPREIRVKSRDKVWFADLWRRHGWDGRAPVTRVEMRYAREARFNRRRRALAQAINRIRRAIVERLDVAQDQQCSIDRLPLPVVQFSHVPQATTDWKAAGVTFGHCCSKKQAIFGFKRHLLITQSGLIRDFALAPANLTDREVGADTFKSARVLLRFGIRHVYHANWHDPLVEQRDSFLQTWHRINVSIRSRRGVSKLCLGK